MTYMTASTVFSAVDNGSDESYNESDLKISCYDDNISIDDEKSFDSNSISITHEEDEPICCNVTVTDGNPSWINKSKKQSHSNSISTSDETSSWVSNAEHEFEEDRSVHVALHTLVNSSTEYDSTTSSL